MSLKVSKIQSNSYLDGNATALVKAGTGITITIGALGSYTVNSSTTGAVTAFTVTTSSGTAVVDLTPFAFANPPVVGLTTVNSSNTQANLADIVTVTATSLTIRTFVTQSTVISILGLTVNPVVVAPTVVVNVILVRV